MEECPYFEDKMNETREMVLFRACAGVHVKTNEMLCLETPIEYEKRSDGQTPLLLVISKLRIGVIKKLLELRPVLAKQVDNFYRTPLHMAALIPVSKIYSLESDYPWKILKISQIGKMLIKKDIHSCYKVDQNKQSALHIAAKEGNASLVKEILKHSNDCLEMVDKDGRNALHLAVKNAAQIFYKVGGYDLKTIITSVMSKRLIDCVDNNGQTALDIAVDNINKDPQLYLSIKNYLLRSGASESSTIIAVESKWKTEFISVTAVLIATVAFAAAFTLPGGIHSHETDTPTPVLINNFLFKVFVIFDTLAFCYSIASAFVLTYALFGNQAEDPRITGISLSLLWIALVSLSLTFGAAIHLVVAPKCLWLAVLVWVMVCILPVCIRIISMEGKLYLFTQRENHILFLLVQCMMLALDVFAPIVWMVNTVFLSGIILPPLHWARKKLRGISRQKYIHFPPSKIITRYRTPNAQPNAVL